MNTKLEECNQNLKETNEDLESCKLENVKLKVELGQQNVKFERVFENLEQEGIFIKNTISKQKVDIEDLNCKCENQDEGLVNIQALIKEESKINKAESTNHTNLYKTLNSKFDENKKLLDERIASDQVAPGTSV